MELETYKVEVLHFINPYLIWVEVPKVPLSEDGSNFIIEQVGVHGLLPLDMTLDTDEDTLKTRRSKEWMPAAAVLMKKAFSDAVEITFAPLRVDNRSTIFDDNTHKYGEFFIKKSNGKYRLLSKLLLQSGFAIQDDAAFESELSNGNVRTKLSHNDAKVVIKTIEKKCKSKLTKQTQIFRTAQKIESALTIQNLEAHNRKSKKVTNVDELFSKKLQDLERCKEESMQSIGRATKKTPRSESDYSSVLQKKMALLKGDKEKPGVSEYFTQRLKELNDSNNTSGETQSPYTENFQDLTVDHDFDDINTFNALTKTQSTPKPETGADIFRHEEHRKETARTSSIEKERGEDKSLETDAFEDFPLMVKKPKKPTKSPRQRTEIDVLKETKIAYGPPGTNIIDLAVKIVPKTSLIESYLPPEEKPDLQVKIENEDLFADEDSDIVLGNFKTTHLPKAGNVSNDSSRKEKNDVVGSLEDKPVNERKGNVFANPVISAKIEIPKNVADVEEIVKSNNISDGFREKSERRASSSILQRKLLLLKNRRDNFKQTSTQFDSSNSDTSTKDSSSFENEKASCKNDFTVSSTNIDSDDSVDDVIDKVNAAYTPLALPKEDVPKKEDANIVDCRVNNVNPFKNINSNLSGFVEKLVTPVLMVHSKMNKHFQPIFSMRDVPFSTNIQIVLKNMGVERAMMIQTITWAAILRGYSTIMIGPKGSGKSFGYLPAVCRLVSDDNIQINSNGPSGIIVCATSALVSQVEQLAKLFCGRNQKVLALYSGMDEQYLAVSLLNGCDLLVTTAPVLVRALQCELSVDLRRLTTFVLDDCERLSEVYMTEIKFFKFKIREMLKSRVNQEVQVQYVLASRVWCDFMEPLAKKAPNTVVCIGAFQECVLYSKAHTIASFVTKESKIGSVLDFLNHVDISKRSVIVCKADEEVDELEQVLKDAKYAVFACNNKMTIQDLYKLRRSWDDYLEPVLGPILLCCDGNLAHLNVTDAHYLFHYSLPNLYSTFCKRFAVLTENYASIFKDTKENVKIKILLEDGNVEQLPKILNFIKRCTTDVPEVLNDVCEKILKEKDLAKAKMLVPICSSLLSLGECPDFWNCQERHAILKDHDKCDWVPQNGIITFKILHFHSATYYSARLLANFNNGETVKYPQTYTTLAMKISMYFGLESNRKLHGHPKVGDICAISMRQNFHLRCQVLKVLSYYENGTPHDVLVNLIDEEKLEKTKNIYLYHLPEELKAFKTPVVHVRLSNIKPKDKDVTFSELAEKELQEKVPELADKDIFMRGRVSLTIGNCVLVDTVEVCRQLSISDSVVIDDFKKTLLATHAVPNPDHLEKLRELCINEDIIKSEIPVITPVVHKKRKLPTPQWAHLEEEGLTEVYFEYAENPDTFFVRLAKFADCCTALLKDIQHHVKENPAIIRRVRKGDLVLANIPNEDEMYERAKVYEIVDDSKVNCFFVDQGVWCEVPKNNLQPITEKFITQLPFQAIECRLLGVKPASQEWSEWVTNCFTNFCLADNPADENDKIIKPLFAQYFVKEKAHYTDGRKYGIVLIDTTTEQDIIINEMMVENNLAKENESETRFLKQLNFNAVATDTEKEHEVEVNEKTTDKDEEDWEKLSLSKRSSDSEEIEQITIPANKPLGKFIRSVPLVGADESDTSENTWDIQVCDEFKGMFNSFVKNSTQDGDANSFSAQNTVNTKSEWSAEKPRKNNNGLAITLAANSASHKSSDSDTTDSNTQKESSSSDMQHIATPKLVDLDSDDLTSPVSSLASSNNDRDVTKSPLVAKFARLSPPAAKQKIQELDLRKPKLMWHQKDDKVSVKILLVGVEKYDMRIEQRHLKFEGEANDTKYGFDFDLYGVVDTTKSRHANKGQYILVTLTKILKRNWLSLTKCEGVKKWIVYDVDSLEYSSSEDEKIDDTKGILSNICKDHFGNSDSEDEDFVDDAEFRYSR